MIIAAIYIAFCYIYQMKLMGEFQDRDDSKRSYLIWNIIGTLLVLLALVTGDWVALFDWDKDRVMKSVILQGFLIGIATYAFNLRLSQSHRGVKVIKFVYGLLVTFAYFCLQCALWEPESLRFFIIQFVIILGAGWIACKADKKGGLKKLLKIKEKEGNTAHTENTQTEEVIPNPALDIPKERNLQVENEIRENYYKKILQARGQPIPVDEESEAAQEPTLNNSDESHKFSDSNATGEETPQIGNEKKADSEKEPDSIKEEETTSAPRQTIRYCCYCGEVVENESLFCRHCGKKIGKDASCIERVKTEGMSFTKLFLRILKAITWPFRWLWKKIHKPLLVIVIIAAVGGIGWAGYYGYTYWSEYSRITDGLHSQDDATSIKFAYGILQGIHWEEYETYKAYYYLNAKNIDEAFDILQRKAYYQGNSEAQFYLGLVYYYGFDKVKDMEKAAYWWNEAAKQNHPGAMNNMGWFYEHEGFLKVDDSCKRMIEYYRKSAELGCAMAQFHYGNLFLTGINTTICFRKDLRWSVNEDEYHVINEWEGDDGKTHALFWFCDTTDATAEILVPKDIDKAKYWWRKSAEQGNVKAWDQLQKIRE